MTEYYCVVCGYNCETLLTCPRCGSNGIHDGDF